MNSKSLFTDVRECISVEMNQLKMIHKFLIKNPDVTRDDFLDWCVNEIASKQERKGLINQDKKITRLQQQIKDCENQIQKLTQPMEN